MPATVKANDLTLAHKGTGGYARSTLPDVCKTPSVPVPYTNISFISTLRLGTQTVFADGYEIAIKGSEQATSIGDEPGVGKGVTSGTQLDRATWLSWSPNVFMEGRPANRLTDKMLMNNGNTVCLAGHWDPKVQGPKGKELCKIACECEIERTGEAKPGFDRCFSEKLKKLKNGLLSNAIYVMKDGAWVMKMSKSNPDVPSGGRVAGSRAPDVTDSNSGDLYELKFGNDDWGAGQKEAYDAIAKEKGGKSYPIFVDDDCDCDGYKKDKKEAEALAQQTQAATLAARVILAPEEGIPEALWRGLVAAITPAAAY